MTARDTWRWTDERGVQRLVGTDELRSALASAILPATTLVWREGMKEWASASTVPELASAAFAAGGAGKSGEAGLFDGRTTQERRATLIGLSRPADSAAAPEGSVPRLPVEVRMSVPSAGEHGDRPPVTQVPPFGSPLPDAVVPRAPRVPANPLPAAGDKAKPKRKITTSELDGQWAQTPHVEDDDTIPRRARPSELAAAAAAAADATAALRGRVDARKGGTAAVGATRRPPPPLPSASARLEARDRVSAKEPHELRPQTPG